MNSKKGITLIALVITIIVMLILVGVTISMALNGGLFGYAKKAARDTESQKQAEQELASGKVTINGKEYASINAYLETMEGVLQENTPYTSDGKTAIVPKGFKIVADENGEKSIDAGLVIQDEAGNQYVWVPVEDGKLDRTDWVNNEPTGTTSSDYTETLPDDLKNSVKTNKGFYIGRYEAGSNSIRTEATKDTLTKVFTQRGLYPYNYVSYENAVRKIGEMYTNKEIYGVEAIMPYGAMWDETLNFVRDDTHNVTNSINWGNYYNNTFKFTGKYCENPKVEKLIYAEANNMDKPKGKAWLLTTGASEKNKAKNIYDLAGNVWECTQESAFSTGRTCRGGDGGFIAGDFSVYLRSNYDPNEASYNVGFRPALYIK